MIHKNEEPYAFVIRGLSSFLSAATRWLSNVPIINTKVSSRAVTKPIFSPELAGRITAIIETHPIRKIGTINETISFLDIVWATTVGEVQWFLRFHEPPSRSGTVWFRSLMVPSCHINYQKFDEFMFGKITTKNWFWRPTSHRSYSVTQGVAKLLTRDFTT